MEYSVYDLIKILLRKWYIILLTMALLGGIAVISSQKSYQKALKDYETYTSQTVPVTMETGTLVAVYQYHYEMTDVTKYLNQAEMKNAFLRKYAESVQADIYDATRKPSVYDEAERVFASVSADFSKLLVDSLVMQKVQSTMLEQNFTEPPVLTSDGSSAQDSEPLVIANHLIVEQIDGSTLRITIAGLGKDAADTALASYLQSLADVGADNYFMKVTTEQTTNDYFADPVQLTDTAQLAQIVMQKPEQAPLLIKAVGTAAAFAFVFACFGILLFTFIKDTQVQSQRQAHAQEK